MKFDDLPEASNDSIVVECELAEPREKVWRALTVPEIVAEWLMPERDARMKYEVIAEERPRRLQYRLSEGDAPAIESIVTFELTATSIGGTHLRIVHGDFELATIAPPCPATLSANAGLDAAALSNRGSPSAPAAADAFDERVVKPNTSFYILRARHLPRRMRRAINRRSTRTRMASRALMLLKAAA